MRTQALSCALKTPQGAGMSQKQEDRSETGEKGLSNKPQLYIWLL